MSEKELEKELEEELEEELTYLKALNSTYSIDSLNLSIPIECISKLNILLKQNATYVRKEIKFSKSFVYYKVKDYIFCRTASKHNIFLTFKGITNYKNQNRSAIYQLIKKIALEIPEASIHRLDICLDFFFNDSFPHHINSTHFIMHGYMKQPFFFKTFNLLKTAPQDDYERLMDSLENKGYLKVKEDNTNYIHYDTNTRGRKRRGIGGKNFFSSYFYDKYIKARNDEYNPYIMPKGVVRLEYQFHRPLLERLGLMKTTSLHEKLPKILNRLNSSIYIEHAYSQTQLSFDDIGDDRIFKRLLSFFNKASNTLSAQIQEIDDDNMLKLSMIQDIKMGLTNESITIKYKFTNQKPITKLRLLLQN